MEVTAARVCGLAIRPGKRAALEERSSLQLTPTSGVVDDHGSVPRRHLTILARSQWQTVGQQLGHDLPWTIRRANMLVSDIEFDEEWSGKTLTIGDVKLLVHGELTPCHRMEEQVTGPLALGVDLQPTCAAAPTSHANSRGLPPPARFL